MIRLFIIWLVSIIIYLVNNEVRSKVMPKTELLAFDMRYLRYPVKLSWSVIFQLHFHLSLCEDNILNLFIDITNAHSQTTIGKSWVGNDNIYYWWLSHGPKTQKITSIAFCIAFHLSDDVEMKSISQCCTRSAPNLFLWMDIFFL